jgi:hypothetical protein
MNDINFDDLEHDDSEEVAFLNKLEEEQLPQQPGLPQQPEDFGVFGDPRRSQALATGLGLRSGEPGELEAFNRGLGHGAFGLGDQLEAAYDTFQQRNPEGVSGLLKSTLGPAFQSLEQGVPEDQLVDYDALAAEDEAYMEQFPPTFGEHYGQELQRIKGLVQKDLETPAGDVGNMIGTGASLLTPTKAFMPLAGIGASEAESLPGLGLDAAIGAVMGKGMGMLGKGLGKLPGILKRNAGKIAGGTVGAVVPETAIPGFGTGTLADNVVGAGVGAAYGPSILKNMGKKLFGIGMKKALSAPYSQALTKPAIEQGKKWGLKFISPIESPALKMFMLKAYPSFNPQTGTLMDVKDRQAHINSVLNNDSLNSEERALRIEKTMKDGKIRYDDVGDEWYEQNGYQVSPLKKEMRKADSYLEASKSDSPIPGQESEAPGIDFDSLDIDSVEQPLEEEAAPLDLSNPLSPANKNNSNSLGRKASAIGKGSKGPGGGFGGFLQFLMMLLFGKSFKMGGSKGSRGSNARNAGPQNAEQSLFLEDQASPEVRGAENEVVNSEGDLTLEDEYDIYNDERLM